MYVCNSQMPSSLQALQKKNCMQLSLLLCILFPAHLILLHFMLVMFDGEYKARSSSCNSPASCYVLPLRTSYNCL
jgi:hypothetical protein